MEHQGLDLTNRQLEIASLLLDGLSDKEIAWKLGISPSTVSKQLQRVYRKNSLSSRRELAIQLKAEQRNRNSRSSVSFGQTPSISGLWVSKYEYESKYSSASQRGRQINIEEMVEDELFRFKGRSLITISERTCYEHEITGTKYGNNLIGMWENSNTRNIGCFQLVLDDAGVSMQGMHLGNAGDNSIASGPWSWNRLINDQNLSTRELVDQDIIEFDRLWNRIDQCIKMRGPMLISELFA